MQVLVYGHRGNDVVTLQKALNKQEVVTQKLSADGIFGAGTERAVVLVQREYGLVEDGVVGQDTWSVLLNDITATEPSTPVQPIELPWVTEALKDLGIREIKGSKHSPEVLQLWKDAKLGGIKNDEIPWCAGAMCAWLERAGIRSPRADSARSFNSWGMELSKPCYGAIVVFTRSGGGHVGIVVGKDKAGNLQVLGGNQNDSVKVSTFKTDRVTSYRYPNLFDIQPPICDPVDFSTSEA